MLARILSREAALVLAAVTVAAVVVIDAARGELSAVVLITDLLPIVVGFLGVRQLVYSARTHTRERDEAYDRGRAAERDHSGGGIL